MKATDFIFEDHQLSEFKGMICSFGSTDEQTISNGSNIEFVSVNPANSPYWNHYATKYTEPISATIQVCKINCEDINDNTFSPTEISEIMRWLNREDGYHRLRFVGDNYYYMAQINVSQIILNGKCVGFELVIVTDKPFAYLEQDDLEFNVENTDDTFSIEDTSDRIGYVYPNMEITVMENGDLNLINSQDESHIMTITDCIEGEVITINGRYMLCTTSSTKSLEKRFNYVFPKIMNTYTNRENVYSSSLKAKYVIKWNPIKKIGIC